METFFCDTGCGDKLEVYVCEKEEGNTTQIGFVMTDFNKSKVSVVMDEYDIKRLMEYLRSIHETNQS